MKNKEYQCFEDCLYCEEICPIADIGVGIEDLILESLTIEDIYVNERQMKVMFSSDAYGGLKEIVCTAEPCDKFDLERGIYIALAKLIYGDVYTPEGIEHAATLFSYKKNFAKKVRTAVVAYNKKMREKEKVDRLAAEREEIIKRKKAKNESRKKKAHNKKDDYEEKTICCFDPITFDEFKKYVDRLESNTLVEVIGHILV